MKKAIAACAALFLLLSLASCGNPGGKTPVSQGNTEGKKDPSAFTKEVTWNVLESVDEDFPFEQYVQDEKEKWYLGREATLDAWFQFSYHKCTKSLEEYPTLKAVKEITGIDMIGRRTAGSYTEAVNLMMATGEFPDLITLDYRDPLVEKLIQNGFVYSLDELMEKYEPGMKEELPARLVEAGTYTDGKMMAFMGLTPSNTEEETNLYYNANQSYNVRHDIWEALGKPSIATPDDLYNTLKLFKQQYPKLNGKDSIALAGYGDYGTCTLLTIGNSFGIRETISVNPDSGEVTTKYLDPNYGAFIAFMNKLNREGLMDPEFFIKDLQQQIETASTTAFMMPWMWHALDPANSTLSSKDPNSVFVAIPPMSATGETFSFPGSSRMGGGAVTLIPKRCSDPEAAIRMLRYAASPAGSLQFLRGNPGRDYVVSDGAVDFSDAVKEEIRQDETSFYAESGMADYGNLVYMPLAVKQSYTDLRNQFDVPNSLPYAYDSTNEYYRMTPMPDSAEGIALSTISGIGLRETALAIEAKTAEESAKIVEAMQKEIRATLDFDKLVKYWTDQYKSNVERFGEPKWGPDTK